MLYFIQGTITKNIKIGTSVQPFERMHQLCSSDPLRMLKVIPDSNDEKSWHKRFSHACSHGEWFIPVPELLQAIAELPDNEYAGIDITPSPLLRGGAAHKAIKAKGHPDHSHLR